MTSLIFKNGKLANVVSDGRSDIRSEFNINYDTTYTSHNISIIDNDLYIYRDFFVINGDMNGIKLITVKDGSLYDANAKVDKELFIRLDKSEAQYVNANKALLLDSSILHSSVNELEIKGNNIINGVVSAKKILFYKDATLSINGTLKVPNKDSLDFSKIDGWGYVNVNGVLYDTDANVATKANPHQYSIKIIKAEEKIKEESYIDETIKNEQNTDVDLLNIEMINNDNFL